SASHEISPLIKLVGRGDTTVVDAYLSPILRRYVAQVAGELGGGSATGFPPPLRGRDREGGNSQSSESMSPPPPTPPPQGGREPSGAGGEVGDQTTRLMFMMSSGGLTAADLFQGKDAILSGPAGGVVGMAETGREAGLDRLIGFDMGGTSTDVSHFD